MTKRLVVCILILALHAHVLATLKCGDLEIKKNAEGTNCTACMQWAFGQLDKSGDDAGWMCLFMCGRHSYNVCDQSIVLWVGTEWNYNCFEMDESTSSVSWSFQSGRMDWADSSGSWAEIFPGIPCNSCTVMSVRPTWTEPCYYCDSCD